MSTDINPSKAQISKTIQSGKPFSFCLANLGKKALTNVAISFARNNVPWLVSNTTLNAINKFEIKTSRKGAVTAGKEITNENFISNIWMILLKS